MYFSGSSLKRHTKGSEKECAAEEKKSLRSRERGREEEEEEGSILSLSFSSPSCRRLSAARILRNSQTRGLNLLLSFPLPPLSLLSFLSMHRFLLALIPSSASFLFLLHPLLLLWPHSLLCPRRPSATDLAPSCNPWSSAFYLPAASFIPSRERLLPSNLPSILPVCSPAVVSVYVCSRASALASLIISLVYFFSGFFRLSPSILRSLLRIGDLSRRSVNVANMRAG